jgi:hypothetical protein
MAHEEKSMPQKIGLQHILFFPPEGPFTHHFQGAPLRKLYGPSLKNIVQAP